MLRQVAELIVHPLQPVCDEIGLVDPEPDRQIVDARPHHRFDAGDFSRPARKRAAEHDVGSAAVVRQHEAHPVLPKL